VQSRRAALEAELTRLRSEEKSLLGEVERLELEVRLRGERLRETELLLQRTNAELDATLQRTRALEASLAAARPVLAQRARALYKLGEPSYLRLLLSVERPSDLLRGYRFVGSLARRDRERVGAFRADLATLGTTRAELERRTQEALALRTELLRARRELDGQRARKTELLTRIVQRKETHAAYVEELQQAEERLGEMLAGLGAADVGVPMAAFRGALPWPVEGAVRVPFGPRKHPRFDTYTLVNGLDIEAPLDAPVRAVHEGSVAFADHFRGYGLMVIVDHGDKHHSLYAHLGRVDVGVGQRVEAGQQLGAVGGTGVLGPGLYFEVRSQGRPEDPADWLEPRRARP
jgi:septal ring factor EnvC (AmiA/AmiB activator)